MTRTNGIIRGITIKNENVQAVLKKSTASLQPCVPHSVARSPLSFMAEK
jgi:hypothetical protein